MALVRWAVLLVTVTGCDAVFLERLPPDAPPRVCTHDMPFVSTHRLAIDDITAGRGSARFSSDEQTLMFHGRSPLTLVVADRTGETYGDARPLSPSTPADSIEPTFPDDQRFVIFSLLYMAGDLQIMRRMEDGSYGPAEPLDTSASYDINPYLQGSTLWFAASRAFSKTAIYAAPLAADGALAGEAMLALADPANLGAPVVSPDGLVLYFASDREPTAGLIDIWMATRDGPTAQFGNLTRLDALNSDVQDYPSWISPDACRLYFTSKRDGPYELWVAER